VERERLARDGRRTKRKVPAEQTAITVNSA
jgi:hypothetical protein